MFRSHTRKPPKDQRSDEQKIIDQLVESTEKLKHAAHDNVKKNRSQYPYGDIADECKKLLKIIHDNTKIYSTNQEEREIHTLKSSIGIFEPEPHKDIISRSNDTNTLINLSALATIAKGIHTTSKNIEELEEKLPRIKHPLRKSKKDTRVSDQLKNIAKLLGDSAPYQLTGLHQRQDAKFIEPLTGFSDSSYILPLKLIP